LRFSVPVWTYQYCLTWVIWDSCITTLCCSITSRWGHEVLFLEHIPHLRGHFVFPAVVKDGRYRTPEEPGASCDLKS
jgi:hypothetical protein